MKNESLNNLPVTAGLFSSVYVNNNYILDICNVRSLIFKYNKERIKEKNFWGVFNDRMLELLDQIYVDDDLLILRIQETFKDHIEYFKKDICIYYNA